jgi:sulfoxide reductase catalytic subunit YedY
MVGFWQRRPSRDSEVEAMGTIERPTPEELPVPAASRVSPELVHTYRLQLTRGEDVIDPETFAGSIPQLRGVAPRVRVGRGRWFNLLWLIPIGFVLLIVSVAVAKGLRNDPTVQRFIARNPGAPTHMQQATGMPPWLRWQHFFNLFLMTFIIRSGVQILTDH